MTALRASLCILVAAAAVSGRSVAADDEIRPYDQLFIKTSPTMPIVGTIDGNPDPSVVEEIVIRTTSGVTTRVRSDQISKIIPRQTAAEVYAQKRKSAQAIREPAARAAAELALGIWCRTPVAVLAGRAPKPEAAVEHLVAALELEPATAQAYPHLVAILDEAGPPEQASAEQIAREVRLYELARRAGRVEPDVLFRTGLLLAGPLGLPDRARSVLEAYLASGDQNLGQLRKARSVLRDLLVGAGETAAAIAMYEKAMAEPPEAPRNFEPCWELGRLHARLGTPEGNRASREMFTRAAAIQPDFPEAQRELAALDRREGDLAAAEKLLKALVDSDATYVPALLDLALVRRALGRTDEAQASLNIAAQYAQGAEAAPLRLVQGTMLEDRGDLAGAIAEYRAAAELVPASVDAKVLLGFALVRAGQGTEALAVAADLVVAHGADPLVFSAACRLRAERELADGKAEAAVDHLLRAAELEPGDAALLERTGIVLARAGRAVSAREHLQKARELGGDRPDTLNALAYWHYGRGELDEAKKLFDRVLQLVPPPKATGGEKAQPVPAARTYAIQGRQLVDDFERLEVWTADFQGPDSPTLDGWAETERFGIDISRRSGAVVLSGRQAGEADGVTSAVLERPVSARTFDRISLKARVDSGKARLGLRLEARLPRGGAGAGLVFYRDTDGALKIQVRTATGTWQPIEPTREAFPERGQTFFPGTARWPDDAGFHVLEIRRSRQAAGSASSRTTIGSRPTSFDLYLDGEPVAWNLKPGGLTGDLYDVGFSGQTDALANEYTITVQSFKVYRERALREKPSQRR